MRTARILLLGTGSMAGQHVKLLKADPRVEVVAGVDTVVGRAASFCEKHGIERSFTDLDDAISWNGFDAVCNVTSDDAHYSTTMKLISAGKHVLCEKPLAENFSQANAMATSAEQAGVINMINLSYRNVAALQKVRRLIADGEIGEIRHVEATYRQSWLVGNHWGDWRSDPKWLWRLSSQHGSRGVLGDVGIHILDFATHAIDMMPVSLQARLKTFDKASAGRIGEYGLDANDSAMISVEFPNGALGIIQASRYMTGYDNVLSLKVFGTQGALEIEHGLDSTVTRLCSGDNVHSLAWRRVIAEPVETNHRKFVTAILSGQPSDPTFRRGADLQIVLDLCFLDEASRALPHLVVTTSTAPVSRDTSRT